LIKLNSLEYKRNSLRTALSALQNQIYAAKDSMKFHQSTLDEKIQNISDMHKKLAQLENIKNNNNKDYQEIESIAEQKANEILNNKKAVILTAVTRHAAPVIQPLGHFDYYFHFLL
jgi:predicted Holliday junction resolvase-like endonuclease